MAVITKDIHFITKCDSHCKLKCLLQNTSIHSMTVILLCLIFSFSFPKLFFSHFPLRNFFMTTSLFNQIVFTSLLTFLGHNYVTFQSCWEAQPRLLQTCETESFVVKFLFLDVCRGSWLLLSFYLNQNEPPEEFHKKEACNFIK